MKYILDTDVVSQRTKPQPDLAALRWAESVEQGDAGLSVMTIQEVRAGIEAMPHGAKRRIVEDWLTNDLLTAFGGRILPVDAAVADECGRLIIAVKKKGHTPELGDTLIAATAMVHGLKVATLNRRHFQWFGVELVTF